MFDHNHKNHNIHWEERRQYETVLRLVKAYKVSEKFDKVYS